MIKTKDDEENKVQEEECLGLCADVAEDERGRVAPFRRVSE